MSGEATAAARLRHPFRDGLGLVRLGRPELVASAVLGLTGSLLAALLQPWCAPLPLLLPAFTAWFFRDPDRVSPRGADLVLAPADGVLDDVRLAAENPFFPGPALRLGIYLSLFDVHVNRAPVAGTAMHSEHRPGRRTPTHHTGRTDGNEQLVTWFRRAGGGEPLVVRQIAGPITRRLCCVLREGDAVAAGQRFGLIKFGSRTELWMPCVPGLQIVAQKGDRMRGGMTVLAHMPVAIRPHTDVVPFICTPGPVNPCDAATTGHFHGARCWGCGGSSTSVPCGGGRSLRRRPPAQRAVAEQVLGHEFAGDQMALHDLLEHLRVAAAVPRALGVDDGDRTARADAQAVRLGALHAADLGQAEFLEARLQELPRRDAARAVAALGVRRVGAEEDVPAGDCQPELLHDCLLGRSIRVGGHARRMASVVVGSQLPR